ncbi:MAG: HAD family hydrolase [bacterium]|nr:HAD family hydrolase [bacterium]
MEDRYLDLTENVKRLVFDYEKHKNLFIAFDFDNTVFDFHKVGDTFPKIERLLRFLKAHDFKLILFTGNEGEKLQEIILYCKEHGYEPDYANESPVMKTTKPYFNILLDDRAGLNEAYQTLLLTLNILNYDYKY